MQTQKAHRPPPPATPIDQRFASLIYLAETKKPIIIVSKENTFCTALETYDYLSDHDNVRLAFSPQEVKKRIKTASQVKWYGKVKICLFDAGKWEIDGIAWQKNPLFMGRLNVQNISMEKSLRACRNADKNEAENLAKKWMKQLTFKEPTFEDVLYCAQIYLAMKAAIGKMDADAAYVLWCGQFTRPLEAKLCFALTKLAEDEYPVGCWRGGNLLPMLMLHAVSGKRVFTPEALSQKGSTMTLKHCFAACPTGSCKYILRNWRTMKGTVTGYCQLPKGRVTLVNSGIGDKIVITIDRSLRKRFEH